MVTVDYAHEFSYSYDEASGRSYPRLTLRLSNRSDPQQAIDVEAYLDSGAERSLIDGRLAKALAIELLEGPEIVFQSAAGSQIKARLHGVRLSHDLLGTFDMEVGFSTGNVSRNLLGRDFFSRVQIGFRESRLMLYMTTSP